MIITLLGSSSAEGAEGAEGDDAYELGKRIGAASHVLKNGGYGGTMAASARGCREAGGHVVGVGIEGHTIDRTGAPNPYNSEVIVKANALERVVELLRCDLVIVLPGHVGTLHEMFSAWVSAIEGHLPPVMLVGPKLKDLLDYLTENGFLKAEHAEHVSVFNSVGELTI
jgi:uncharacterized protein (TIGR00725 family)